MNFGRVKDMQIKNFAKTQHLVEFNLTKRAGEHSRLNFTASITDDEEASCLACAGKKISVATSDSTPIFLGRVESVEVERTIGAAQVKASCVSLSALTDEKKKSRLFHNPDKKISDVLSKSRLALEECNLTVAENLAAKKYPQVILQNQETNFNFIKRLADKFNVRLWVEDTSEPCAIKLDDCLAKGARTIEQERILSIRRVKEGKRERNFFTSRTCFQFGGVVKFESKSGGAGEFVIVGLKVWLEHESFIFRYELEELAQEPTTQDESPTLAKSVKLRAKVTNTKDLKNLGRIQVKFEEPGVEDMDEKNPLWIPYRSPYFGQAGGIVFLPDKGDAVEIFFINEELYAVTAFRESALPQECMKVEEKYIGNNFKQRIFWREKSLEFFSDKHKIIMNDKGIELTVGDNSIFLTEQGILLKTKDSKVSLSKDAAAQIGGKAEVKAASAELNATGKVKVGGKELSLDAQGNLDVKANSTLKLAGGKINLC